jgi:hypothetical protein
VREDAVAFGYVVCAREQRARAFPAHSLKYRNTYAHGLSCVESCSERAFKTDVLVGSSDQACLSAASLSLVWPAPTSFGEIIAKTDCNMRDFIYK